MSETPDSTETKKAPMFDHTLGLILSAEAYPSDDNSLTVKLALSASPGEPYVFKDYLIRKADAKALADGLALILASPDTETAWQQIANRVEEHDPDWAELEKTTEA